MATYPDKVRRQERAERRKHRRGRGGGACQAGFRIAEINRLFIHRYGSTLPDDDAGLEDAMIVGHHLAHLRDPERRLAAFLDLATPWMSIAQQKVLTAKILEKPLRWRADTLGQRLNLTIEERLLLNLRTIGAVGQTKEQRLAERRQQKKQAAEKRRRAAGAVPMAERQANSLKKRRPWAELGISRATWFRLQKIASGETETNACPV